MSRGLDEWQTPIKLIMINYLADGNDGDNKDEEDYDDDDVKQRRWWWCGHVILQQVKTYDETFVI